VAVDEAVKMMVMTTLASCGTTVVVRTEVVATVTVGGLAVIVVAVAAVLVTVEQVIAMAVL